MRSGARGLARLLDAEVEVIESPKKRRWPLALAAAVGAAGGLLVLRRRSGA